MQKKTHPCLLPVVKFSVFILLSLSLHLAIYGLLEFQNVRRTTDISVIEIGTNLSSGNPSSIKSRALSKKLPSPRKSSDPNFDRSSAESSIGKEESPNSGSEFGSGSASGELIQPPRVIKESFVKYPKAAKTAGIEGVVELQLLIDTHGQVEEAQIIRGPGYGLNEAALEAIKQFSFSPAIRQGEKVSARIIYKYRFLLR